MQLIKYTKCLKTFLRQCLITQRGSEFIIFTKYRWHSKFSTENFENNGNCVIEEEGMVSIA